MAGRGSFQAIAPDDVARLMTLEDGERWDFAAGEVAAKFVARMDKAWVAIHCALSDGTLYGTLGEPPLADAVLGDHLVYQSRAGSYVYLKHPPEVADIAQELSTLSREQFEEKLAVVEEDVNVKAFGLSFLPDGYLDAGYDAGESEYVWAFFEHMRTFYRRAAAEGLAVLFTWG
jgi:hypothetical protein